MNKPDLKVIQLRNTNLRDIAALLRKTADDIDSGAYAVVNQGVLVLKGDEFHVFGFGDVTASDAHFLLGVGQYQLQGAAFHGGEW